MAEQNYHDIDLQEWLRTPKRKVDIKWRLWETEYVCFSEKLEILVIDLAVFVTNTPYILTLSQSPTSKNVTKIELPTWRWPSFDISNIIFFNQYKHHQLLRLAEKESKAHPWNIRASRSYYEVKLHGEAEVIQISKRIDKLKSEMVVLKSSYRQAMVNLDAISTQVWFLYEVLENFKLLCQCSIQTILDGDLSASKNLLI